MPDHIHMFLSYARERDLQFDVIRKIKGASSRYFRRIVEAQEPYLWTRGHYAVFIRSDDQFTKTIAYIQDNPQKQHLDSASRLLTLYRQ